MLPVVKTSFDSNDITFRNFHSLSSIEEILFWDFLIHNSRNGNNIFPGDMNADGLIKHLKENLADENVWVVYFKHQILGFWFLEDRKTRVVVESFIEPEISNHMIESFYYGFFKAINGTSKTPLYFNIAHIPSKHKKYFTGQSTVEEDELVNCDNILVENEYSQFIPLFEQIKKFY